ncbi:uncharacterized protein J4E92_010399 [Alternaria infectoria]|uniref:uncharacterized protein n=1 Tax=Alternaria infectoria TaxID=45303 RepID=UPI00221EB921|nr:uncharacterized protein J4E92_010399 [Alternaria infectoria]KAI4910640.1 hypothetical protein J4E92_010399 [Alternaria infectoria]
MPSSHMLANPSVVDEDQDNGPRMVNISPVCNFRRLIKKNPKQFKINGLLVVLARFVDAAEGEPWF